MRDFAKARTRMVEQQIAARGIKNPDLLRAMNVVPREGFVPEDLHASAYDDSPLPIEAGQTISQPYIVALMIESAGVRAGDRVLEIGAGSGYAAAVLAQVAGEVVAVERLAELAALASERMARLGYGNVEIRHADGSVGWPEKAPFDAILAAASGPHVPDALLAQLAVGGRLIMPIGGSEGVQRLLKVTHVGSDAFEREDLGPVRFVPLIGTEAWPES